ncbi:hypothetical protein [Achromobacter xylosoxidans]|uniref:hypothetical protein n=1 Tax=Alcaligenes xylosoxydans xylosoxydans TaxID=85698 RepID=UPI001F1413D5|nr:hypothetical protein [Achromobacter xylosoxidans]
MPEIGSSQVNSRVSATHQSAPQRATTVPTAREVVKLAADLISVSPSSRTAIENVKSDGQTLSQSSARLTQLSGVKGCGKIESLDDLDDLLREIQDLDKTPAGARELLLHGAKVAVCDELTNFKRLANDRPLPSEKLSKAERKARAKILTKRKRWHRVEIARRAFDNWRSCAVVARVLELNRDEQNQLELYAVECFCIPRVQRGDSCRQVLSDFGIGEGVAKELLQAIAVEGLGVFRVENGEDWRKVHKSLDVDPKKLKCLPSFEYTLGKAALYHQGIPRLIRGEDPGAVANELGFDTLGVFRDRLERAALGKLEIPQKSDPEKRYQQVTENLFKQYAHPEIYWYTVATKSRSPTVLQ